MSVFAEAILLAMAAKEICALLVVRDVPLNANFTSEPVAPEYPRELTMLALFRSCVMMLEKSAVERVEIDVCVVEYEFAAIVLILMRKEELVLRNERVDTPPPKEEIVLFTNPIVLL